VKLYSGGMRRRLDLAASLILAPPVLFLDEPTTGLDPRGRNEVWDAVRGLVAGGTTVLLTTQYLDEADQLATSIAVMDAGRVIATGTPEALKAKLGGDRIDVVVRDAAAVTEAATVLGQVVGRPADVDADRRWISAQLAGGTDCAGCCGAGGTDCAGCCGAGGTRVRDRMAALTESLRALEDAGIAVEDLNLRRPTLDEVFLSLTGERTGSRALRTERAGLSGGAR
jgi:ABC-2 type transport system ATP-binding protein